MITITPLQRTQRDRINRYNKSHRSKEKQEAHDTRIIHITARRFGLSEGQQFPLEAIILMADKGVVKAKQQYHQLHRSALQMNISVRKAYEYFVLGKELPQFESSIKITNCTAIANPEHGFNLTNTEEQKPIDNFIPQSENAAEHMKNIDKSLRFAKAYGAKIDVTT